MRSSDERVAQQAATEILDRYLGKPQVTVNHQGPGHDALSRLVNDIRARPPTVDEALAGIEGVVIDARRQRTVRCCEVTHNCWTAMKVGYDARTEGFQPEYRTLSPTFKAQVVLELAGR